MNRPEKREPEYPAELETQFVLKLPEEPAKLLREVLTSGENLKNRLTIQIDNDMRHGEVRFDHWLMHSKIVDIPTIAESLKTIDNKSFYKTADICQMMICKNEPDQPSTEEESPVKNKKKDPYKVDKKFLWPHGVTPPTKNIRKRRFRKTLKKKFAEAPEIEKEVKRLLRADNEAVSITWEVIKEEEDTYTHKTDRNPSSASSKPEKKQKEKAPKQSPKVAKQESFNIQPSDVDIFGGNLSDSDLEDDNLRAEIQDSHYSAHDSRMSDTNSMQSMSDLHKNLPTEFKPNMFQSHTQTASSSHSHLPSTSGSNILSEENMSEEDTISEYPTRNKEDMSSRIEQLRAELEELKQRRKRTQHEISGMENVALRQRFQDILHTLNQDIMYKEMEYQGLITLQNSDDI